MSARRGVSREEVMRLVYEALEGAGDEGLPIQELRRQTGLTTSQISRAWRTIRHARNGRQAVMDFHGRFTRYYLIDDADLAQRDLVFQEKHIATRLDSAIVFTAEALRMAERSGSEPLVWQWQNSALRQALTILTDAADGLRSARERATRETVDAVAAR